jgi:hypothetical protein
MHRDVSLSDMGPRSAADGDRLSILSQSPGLQIPLDIQLMSDTELVALTRALRRGFLAYIWLIVPLATAAAALTLGAWAAALACVLALAICKLSAHLYESSKAKQRGLLAKREFCARYHIGSLSVDEAAAVAQLSDDPALPGVILFRAWALPHGGHRFVRIELGEKPSIAVYSTPFLGDLQEHPALLAHTTKVERGLSEAQLEGVNKKLAALWPVAQQPEREQQLLKEAPLAGLPCDVVVLRRGQEPLRTSVSYHGTLAPAPHVASVEALVSSVLELESEIMGRERFALDPLLTGHYAELTAELRCV